MKTMRYALLLAIIGVLLVACGGGLVDDPQGQTTVGLPPDGSTDPTTPDPGPGIRTSFPFCSDVDQVRAPDDAYRDTPIYVGNEQPVEQVRAWAEKQPGFVTLWVDRERNGWITVAFTEGAELRQQELLDAFPDVGVVAVTVDWTEAELAELQDRVVAVLRSFGWNFSVGGGSTTGYVSAGIGVLSADRLAVLEENFPNENICVSGIDPADAIPDGPQAEGGDDWRLLAAEIDIGKTYWTDIAWNAESYSRLWSDAGISASAPEVDFETEVVIWFGAVYSSGCSGLRLDDVEFDSDRRLVHGRIVLPSSIGAGGCNADARPHAFVVAVPRDQLPDAPFSIQLSDQDPPAGAPEERAIVAADLRVPGSVAPEGSITRGTHDPVPSIPFAGPDEVIEPGFPTRIRMHTHCGVNWVGLNGVTWFAADAPSIPDEWLGQLDEETIVVEVLISEGDPPTLVATANDFSVTYQAVAQDLPGCD